MTRGRAFLYAVCLAMELGGIASGRVGNASVPWNASREEWDKARAAYRAARWSGTLEQIAGSYARSARAESLYLGTLESWALGNDADFTPPRAGSPEQTRFREGVLDLTEHGRIDAALRILNGPLHDDAVTLPVRARLVGLRTGSTDSALALLAWPPDRRPAGPRAIAWDFLGRATGDEVDAAKVVAAALADSANEPRVARAALWSLLSHPRPAVRSYARIRLVRSLLSHGEPLLAGAILESGYGISDAERLLLANLRADQAASLGDTLQAVRQLIWGTQDPQITTATRYALATRAAAWLQPARLDALEEAMWLDLARTLGNIGEAETALSLLHLRRTTARTAPEALARAEVEASLLARLKRNTEAAAAYRRLLGRVDQPRETRAKYALGLARALRAAGDFGRMDSAFVVAVSLDSTGATASQAAWERAREWEDKKSPKEAAEIFNWSRPYIRDPALARVAMGHGVIAWLRAGEPDSAKGSIVSLFEDERGYWQSKIDFARGDTAAAIYDLQTVPLSDPWTYEAVRAKEELTRRGVPLYPQPRYGPVMEAQPGKAASPSRSGLPADASLAAEPPIPIAVRLYGSIGAMELLMDALRDGAQSQDDPRARASTDALEEKGIFRVGRSNLLPWDRLEYPPAYPTEVLAAAERESVSAALLWAIMRQESAYQRAARSKAGAIGLLQLLPSTASRLYGAPVTEPSLTEADLNVRLGAQYLRNLLREFGDPRAAAAAYNAGEDAVRRWMADRPNVDDFWVELIPYRETRDYVKQVYSIWRRYEALYGGPSYRDADRGPRG